MAIHISPADYVKSVLAGMTEGFFAIHVTSGAILTARVCHQLCMVFTTNLLVRILHGNAFDVECQTFPHHYLIPQLL